MKISGRNLNLDLKQIELIAAMGENRTLSAAAVAVDLSQSAASHALAKLRRELGDPLYVRTSAGMQLTPRGQTVARAARLSLLTLREGIEPFGHFDPQRSERSFTLFMSDIGQTVFLPPLLTHLSAQASPISLRVSPIPPQQPGGPLESGDVDLAIGFFTNLDAGFRQRYLFTERYVCVARTGHPAFSRGMSLEAFHSVPHAITTSSGQGHQRLERILRQEPMRGRVMLEVPHFLVLPFVIAKSDLMVIMPRQLAEAFAGLAPILIMDPPIWLPTYDIRIYWHERFHADPANRWLRETCFALLSPRSA
jgi:DNA-binding transcriptional LysR family regulator